MLHKQNSTINGLARIATLIAGALGVYALCIIGLGIFATFNNDLGAGGAFIQGTILLLGSGLFLFGLHREKMPLVWLATLALLVASPLFFFGAGLPPIVGSLILLVLLILIALVQRWGR